MNTSNIMRCADADCRSTKSKIWYEHDRAMFCEECNREMQDFERKIIKKKGDKMEEIIGYCMKCKKKRKMVEIKKKIMENGNKMAKGKCEKCDCGMCKILGKEKK